MNRIERLTGILLALQSGRFTADQLADRFELSRRTILRDMDALSQIGVPIVAIAGPGGGYSLPPDFWLAPLHLRLEEATTVLLALRQLGDLDTSPLGPAHASVLAKVRAAMRADVRDAVDADLASIDVQHPPTAPQANTLAVVRSALRESSWCAMTYASPRETTERDVQPRRIALANGHWYLHALDSLRRAERVFRIDRIASLRLIEPPADAASVVQEAAASSRPYDDEDHPLVVAELTAVGAARCREHADFRDRLTVGLGVATLRFRCPPHELPYYARELLALGTEVRVLDPPELRVQMRAMVAAIQSHLQDDRPDIHQNR